jgi:hypothetical protein
MVFSLAWTELLPEVLAIFYSPAKTSENDKLAFSVTLAALKKFPMFFYVYFPISITTPISPSL